MIILDMDGVLANFPAAACEVHHRPSYEVTHWDFFKDWDISAAEFWQTIHEWGDDFYRDIVQPYPWLDDLLNMVRRTDEFIVMSAPSNSPNGYAAKKIWLDKYVGEVQLIVGSQKQLLARKDRLLIDDYDKNIDMFRREGGCCLVFPQPWNCMAGQADRRLTYVEHRLEWWEKVRGDKKNRVETELYNWSQSQ